jgi:hypothetical protein
MNTTDALLGTGDAQQQCEELLKQPLVLLLMTVAAASEALPFLKKYRCNGLAHFVVTFVTALATAAQEAASPPTPPNHSRRASTEELASVRRAMNLVDKEVAAAESAKAATTTT